MATVTHASSQNLALKAFDDAVAIVLPRVPLTHREFARRYVRMPAGGPHGDEMYRDEWQPVLGVLWDELDRNYWQEVVATGPVQASKTFGVTVVPTLRDIAELKFSPILGVPEADMFADKWDRDFKPVLQASDSLRWLLPDTGSGQRGGRVRDRVTFGNGTDLKVMSRGGQATNKAGYTTPRLRITEAAGFSGASTSERDQEADSYRQLVGRLGAFDLMDPRRLVSIEGTLTVADQLPYRLRGEDDDETLISSRSRLLSPCPHCGVWISPEREHLVGWQNATNVIEAYENARFLCPSCAQEITDEQRKASIQSVRIVHHGQELTPDGEIVGPMPPTRRLWFRWSVWHNCLISIGTVAVAEWEAAQIEEGTLDRDNAERDLCQKKWATPYKPRDDATAPLNPTKLAKRTNRALQRGLLPANTQTLTIGVDLGFWRGHWAAVAFTADGRLHVVAYGVFPICDNEGDDVESKMQEALAKFDEEVVLEGFAQDGTDGALLPDAVWVDMNYKPDAVGEFVRSRGSGWDSRWKACRGRGKSIAGNNGGYYHPKQTNWSVARIGTQWYAERNPKRGILEVTLSADHWVDWMQDRLRAPKDQAGSMSLFRPDTPKEHDKFCNHLASDQISKIYDPRKGAVVEKRVHKGDNHWGDAVKEACAAADACGWRLREILASKPIAITDDQQSAVSLTELKRRATTGI
jgi:hypothetical protein